MRQDSLLDPDLAEAARRLIGQARLLAEREPEFHRAAVRGRTELARFFATELGWTLDVLEPGDMVRLHKRRHDMPGERAPRLRRSGRERTVAPRMVLIMTALVCEQLWRRPRMTLNDLLQAVAQVCAADSEQGLLPRFAVVPGEGITKREAHANRQGLVDALRLLRADGTIAVEGDLDQAAEGAGDGIVAASRDRLTAKFSSLSPSLLKLAQLPPHRHAEALTADLLAGDIETADPGTDDGAGPGFPPGTQAQAAPDRRGDRAATTRRRQQAIRRLVDDPGTDPRSDDYLQTSTGRNRALDVLHALGLVATVRRDWWQVTDPSGLGSALGFPQGRRSERQAALALLEHLAKRPPTGDGRERPVALEEMTQLLEQVRARLPRWAAAYDQRLPMLAEAAAGELAEAGFLIGIAPDHEACDAGARRWLPTPAVRMWRITVTTRATGTNAGEDSLSLFDGPEGEL
ncbi:DUF2398 family protein [Nocardia sp. CNY236]|uniref:DUF2398 family protein n=1 Tax=Nocardia sp. CNY236 TaxID=1169152 RepID=UPI0004252EDC|nr:DUF2398 family protein [Nocardia sp. CNY236]